MEGVHWVIECRCAAKKIYIDSGNPECLSEEACGVRGVMFVCSTSRSVSSSHISSISLAATWMDINHWPFGWLKGKWHQRTSWSITELACSLYEMIGQRRAGEEWNESPGSLHAQYEAVRIRNGALIWLSRPGLFDLLFTCKMHFWYFYLFVYQIFVVVNALE